MNQTAPTNHSAHLQIIILYTPVHFLSFGRSPLTVFNQACKPLFALLFLAFRCAYFPIVMWGFWRCLLEQLMQPSLIQVRPTTTDLSCDNLIRIEK